MNRIHSIHRMIPTITVALACAILLTWSPAVAGGAGVVHEVNLEGVSFVPQDLIGVIPGDTVRWIRTAGNHSVTSGPPCTYDEQYFDVELNDGNSVFEWVVPANVTGVVDYFCRPHCSIFDMFGTITVEGNMQDCFGDIDTSGEVDFIDLLTVLTNWGPCAGCSADINGNDVVDFQDLLTLLASWGPCP